MNISYRQYFEGRRVTKQGFGVLGRGFGVVKFLLDSGSDIIVTDMKPREYFEKQIEEIEVYKRENNLQNKIEWVFGEHRMQDFEKENCDFVIQASGVPKDNIYLAHAKENSLKVYQEGSLFAEIVKDKIKIIGVTGTRGKTTTTFLIYEILKNYFGTPNVHLGGNVQGVATLELLKKIKQGDYVIMEMDSWLLQGFADIKFSPHIAVFTNFMPDHMNYYKNNMDEYFLDKSAIFSYQTSKDLLITHEKMRDRVESSESAGEKIFVSDEEVDEDKVKYDSEILGEHNRYYITLAKHVAENLSITNESFLDSVRDFSGVAGRLEMIREIGGVKYINDTTATTGEASSVALDTFKEKSIILISGGRDKELNLSNYASKVIDFKNKNIIKKVILLNDDTTTGTHKLLEIFDKHNFSDFVLVGSIEDGVGLAKENGVVNDVVLFTPAFASFGMFQNEYDRGERYDIAVKSLK